MDAIVKDAIISLAVELGWLGAPVVRTHLDGWGRQLSVRTWMAGGASCPYADVCEKCRLAMCFTMLTACAHVQLCITVAQVGGVGGFLTNNSNDLPVYFFECC
jgi:hypothetical protein